MLEGVLAIERVLLGLVPLPVLDHYYVERRLLTCVQQIGQHFLVTFSPWSRRCWIFAYWGRSCFGFSPVFCRLPNRIIFPFEIRNVFFKGFIPHFLGFGFKFIACSVKYSSAVRCAGSLSGWPATSLLISWGMLLVFLWRSLFGVASLAACWRNLSKLLILHLALHLHVL